MRFLDCVSDHYFENFFYLDGITNKLGYNRFKKVDIQGSHIETAREFKKNDSKYERFISVVSTIFKLACMLTVVVPLFMLGRKIHYRQTHAFSHSSSSKKPLNQNEMVTVGTY